MTRERLAATRLALLLAAHRFLELTHHTPIETADAELLRAADAVDEACGELLSAARDHRRHGTRADRAEP